MMDTMEPFLLDYGYWVLFIVTFLEGETILLVAAYLASQGYLNIWLTTGVAAGGTFLGDQVYFWIGRRYGKEWLKERKKRWRKRVSRVLRMVRKWDAWFILSYRFFYGIRNVSSFAMGISKIQFWRFMVLNLLASLIWAAIFASAGFYFGKTVEHYLGQAKEFQAYIIGGIVAVGILVWVIHKFREKRERTITVEDKFQPL
ncbi:MAG: DedA family protein [Magnetococcales bacterium]|nr:DedA family protein [Magnetococcales bacterium]